MPAKSKAQFRLMQAAKHDPEVRERTGISKKVAAEFTGSSPKGLPQHKSDRGSKAAALRAYR